MNPNKCDIQFFVKVKILEFSHMTLMIYLIAFHLVIGNVYVIYFASLNVFQSRLRNVLKDYHGYQFQSIVMVIFCFTIADVNIMKSVQKFEGQVHKSEKRV